jgi:putative hydrolase of the HAD superfamily
MRGACCVPAVAEIPSAGPDWAAIRTVCLDMDGTVLDLSFDNLFWLDALPRHWGERHGVPAAEAIPLLKSRFDARRGTLEWYCIDHWSEELDFDIAGLKSAMSAHIRYLPGALEFLDAARALGKRLLLTTNAHPISLAVKQRRTDLARHFDELVSSHEFGVPKESPAFWTRLAASHGVDPADTLFVDDSAAVLEAARAAGVGAVYQLLHPDSTQPPRAPVPGFPGIRSLADLVPRP